MSHAGSRRGLTVLELFAVLSAHADGFNMAFCDGRVRLLDYEIDPQVHRWQGNRRDGKVFQPE